MKIKLVAYGIAKDILKGSKAEIELKDGKDIASLKGSLVREYPAFKELASLRFAVNEDYQEDSFELSATDEVIIIPPVSGG